MFKHPYEEWGHLLAAQEGLESPAALGRGVRYGIIDTPIWENRNMITGPAFPNILDLAPAIYVSS